MPEAVNQRLNKLTLTWLCLVFIRSVCVCVCVCIDKCGTTSSEVSAFRAAEQTCQLAAGLVRLLTCAQISIPAAMLTHMKAKHKKAQLYCLSFQATHAIFAPRWPYLTSVA